VDELSCGFDSADEYDIDDSEFEQDANDYTDGYAQLEGSSSYARAAQEINKCAVPDLSSKEIQVQNGDSKTISEDKEQWAGLRKKCFKICGSITVEENVCGSTCKAAKGCDAVTSKNIIDKVSRTTDGEAVVDNSGACSYVDGLNDCSCSN